MGVAVRTRDKHAQNVPTDLNLEPKVQRTVHVTESNARDCYL